ncbi:MAG: dTMP kinase [Deltaproteobacteria bacterium]|nr:dTMP kinase [Deltaproteobacteria bacterium]
MTFEGIDGSGTTTQARRMFDALVKAAVPVHVTQEPSGGPVGSIIRQIIQRRIVTLGRTGSRRPSWDTMGLLFAADRLDHLECEIEPNLQDGINVISDRYLHSSIVYQSVTSAQDGAREWLALINGHARTPDLVLQLDVQPEEAHRRRMERQTMVEMYDDPELQEKLSRGYKELFESLDGVNVARIDGSLTEDEVHAACMDQLRELGLP